MNSERGRSGDDDFAKAPPARRRPPGVHLTTLGAKVLLSLSQRPWEEGGPKRYSRGASKDATAAMMMMMMPMPMAVMVSMMMELCAEEAPFDFATFGTKLVFHRCRCRCQASFLQVEGEYSTGDKSKLNRHLLSGFCEFKIHYFLPKYLRRLP